ncbi:ATP-binding protein [Streptomyces sioyaensis]|uniref:ATP-binding protein n=1 Tax=Streptomyces sioyaensis TaxID=67364 RepID=UPI0037A1CB52
MTTWADRRPLPGVVGRAVEHEQLSGLLDRARLVTLTGAAGVGKSVLARAVLEEHTARYDGTVLRVGCWDGPSRGGPAEALLRAAGPAYAAGQDPAPPPAHPGAGAPPGGAHQADATADPLAALTAYCRQRRAIVLLDDCDPQLDACARLVRPTRRCGSWRPRGARWDWPRSGSWRSRRSR